MVRKYKSVFFDLDDTLWDTATNARDSFLEVYSHFHFDRFFQSFEHFYGIYTVNNEQLWVDYAAGLIAKEELNERRFSYPLQQVGVDDPGLVHDYSGYFFSIVPFKEKLVPSAREVLKVLKERGYRLYILSNGFRELQDQKMQSSDIQQYFDKVVLSEDIGLMKPNPQLFYFAMSATQSELHSSLMIGDNFHTDITGAHNAGIDQVFFNPKQQKKVSFKPTYEVEKLTEVLDILS